MALNRCNFVPDFSFSGRFIDRANNGAVADMSDEPERHLTTEQS